MFDLLLNKWGRILYGLFSWINPILLILILSFIIIIFCLLILKFKGRKIVIVFSLMLIISYLVILIPYKRGERINELIIFGYEVVNCIQDYKNFNKNYPTNLNLINPSCTSLGGINLSNEISYNKYSLDTSKIKIQDDDYIKNIPEYYSLTIYEDFMGFQYISYKYMEKKFIFSTE